MSTHWYLKRRTTCFLGTVEELTLYMGKCYDIKVLSQQGEKRYTTQDINQTLKQILADSQQQHLDILDMRVSRGTLEQHFLSIAGGDE
ncbi:hypothetical protein NMU03_03640 [Allocoprobacillus halotolerans]|uniref:ABC-2 type transport system ATP-binding protein n=1 Tax=Allocoprobacillus halotolerans TaxID=2944914 RepID=A0ABY5I575_9FIRM|nr:hypothetical protein [Allocoprobacillus halotolerans]UTY39907.1 hypothetical protein NMU03_03640 [Allocoprobacillus halotolerans]